MKFLISFHFEENKMQVRRQYFDFIDKKEVGFHITAVSKNGNPLTSHLSTAGSKIF